MNIYMLTCSHTNTCTSILTHVHLYSHTCACSTYIYTCACSQIHTYTPAHVHIHTYILYLYRSLYLKARPLITIWNGLVFLCFLRAKLSEFITHFSIYAAAMPAHTRNIFCARNACSDEMSLLTYTLQCEQEAIDSFFSSAWEFLGSYEKEWCNSARESLCVFPVFVILKDRLCTDLPTFSIHSCGPSHTERLVLAHLFLEQTCN